jgi:hypothetical protein
MYQPRVFCVKLQLHFGGDITEISVPAYGGAEPTVTDLMNVVERDFRVPRALQNLVFHGQDLHFRLNEPLSRFGIRNGATIRLAGRMAPPDLIQQINTQYNTIATFDTCEQSLPYYNEQFQYAQNSSVGTQYDPPPNQSQPSGEEQKPPVTPNSSNIK